MNEETKIVTLDSAAEDLEDKTLDVANSIIQEQDVTKLKELTHLFNLQHTKKQVIRTLQYDKLLDNITNQIQERVEKRADQFSNKELLDYMNVMSTSLDKAQKQLTTVDETPLITVNQKNNTVIVCDTLSRESRRKVTSVVDAILAKIKNEESMNTTEEIVYYSDKEEIQEEPIIDTSCIELLTEEDS